MLSRRTFAKGTVALGAAAVWPGLCPAAAAVEWTPFAWEPFEAAHTQAIPVVVVVRSDDCSVCKLQEAALDEVLAEHSFVMFLRFRVDFDRQRDVAEKLKVEQPGTILGQICYEEIGRIVGATDATAVRKLLEKTQIA